MNAATPGRRATRAPGRSRSKGRELALKFLYQADVRPEDAEGFEDFVAHEEDDGQTVAFAREIVDGVVARKEALDAAITTHARNWSIRRMAILDRNILRIGAFELLREDPEPRSVVLNEAIELGKKFGTADSGKFINGILDRIGRGEED